MKSLFSAVFLISSMVSIYTATSYAVGPQLNNKIAFIRDGDVWLTDHTAQEMTQLTQTGGRVIDFIFSNSSRYLAYSKRLNQVGDVGTGEGDSDEEFFSSIVITDPNSQKMIREIMPPEDQSIHLFKWLPDQRLILYDADKFSIGFHSIYDIPNNTERKLDSLEDMIDLVDADFSMDGFLRVSPIIDPGKSFIAITDLKTNQTKTVSPTTKDKSDPKISHSKGYISWFESNGLWIYDLKTNQAKVAYQGIQGQRNLSWSFNDRFICMSSNHKGEALILDLQDGNTIHRVNGKDFVWVSNEKVIFTRNDHHLYSYDLTSKKTALFIKNASHPAFLR